MELQLTAFPPRAKWIGALRLVRATKFRTYSEARSQCRSPREVFAFMNPHAARELGEVFWILILDAQHNVMFDSPVIISTGILNSSLVHPREVFRPAIHYGAAAIILTHNHPSGDPTPSADDRAVTEQLVAAGRILDIPVRDHVIIGDTYYSFAEAGLL